MSNSRISWAMGFALASLIVSLNAFAEEAQSDAKTLSEGIPKAMLATLVKAMPDGWSIKVILPNAYPQYAKRTGPSGLYLEFCGPEDDATVPISKISLGKAKRHPQLKVWFMPKEYTPELDEKEAGQIQVRVGLPPKYGTYQDNTVFIYYESTDHWDNKSVLKIVDDGLSVKRDNALAAATDLSKNQSATNSDIPSQKPNLPAIRQDLNESLPHPQVTAQKYLLPAKGQPKEPEKAIAEMQLWFDANRDSDAYAAALDFAYARMAWAYRESAKPEKAETFFQSELKLTKNPKALYAIHCELAQIFAARKQWSQAEELWLEARRIMLDGQHAYFTTRQALPYLEVAKMYKTAGNAAKAIHFFELYQNTAYGMTEENGLCETLGELYGAQGEWSKVVGLCEHYIEAYSKMSFANEQYKQELIAKFRKRLDEAEKKSAGSPKR